MIDKNKPGHWQTYTVNFETGPDTYVCSPLSLVDVTGVIKDEYPDVTGVHPFDDEIDVFDKKACMWIDEAEPRKEIDRFTE